MSLFSAVETFVGCSEERTGDPLQNRVAQLFEESRQDVYRYP